MTNPSPHWQTCLSITHIRTALASMQSAFDTELLSLLDLSPESLTYYLEEAILENPFIELIYPREIPSGKTLETPITSSHTTEEGYHSAHKTQSLTTFLFEQIMMYRQTPIRDAMVYLVDFIDERGYLPYDYQTLAEKLSLDPIVVLDAMTLLKQLEPSGIGAYDLQECLMLQTEQDTQAPPVAYYLLENYFDLFEQQQLDVIQSKSGWSFEEIDACIHYFHSLRPIPAAIFEKPHTHELVPDISVRQTHDTLEVSFNAQYLPKLMFNQSYFDEIRSHDDPSLISYATEQHDHFVQLNQRIILRHTLIWLVTQALLDKQADYLLGRSHTLSVYLLKDLAKDLQLSESLVNLIVTNVLIEWKTQLIPLTDLINVTHHKGRGGLSAVNIKELIHSFIKKTPSISNQELVAQLKSQNIIISEKLVQEYRKH